MSLQRHRFSHKHQPLRILTTVFNFHSYSHLTAFNNYRFAWLIEFLNRDPKKCEQVHRYFPEKKKFFRV